MKLSNIQLAPAHRFRVSPGRLVGLVVVAQLYASIGLAAPQAAIPGDLSEQRAPRTGLGFRARGGAIHSLGAGIDGGGDFDSTRAVMEGSLRYAFSENRFVGLSIGYSWDGYGFSPSVQIGGQTPWDRCLDRARRQTFHLSGHRDRLAGHRSYADPDGSFAGRDRGTGPDGLIRISAMVEGVSWISL
jgi:hypothetical protein